MSVDSCMNVNKETLKFKQLLSYSAAAYSTHKLEQ